MFHSYVRVRWCNVLALFDWTLCMVPLWRPLLLLHVFWHAQLCRWCDLQCFFKRIFRIIDGCIELIAYYTVTFNPWSIWKFPLFLSLNLHSALSNNLSPETDSLWKYPLFLYRCWAYLNSSISWIFFFSQNVDTFVTIGEGASRGWFEDVTVAIPPHFVSYTYRLLWTIRGFTIIEKLAGTLLGNLLGFRRSKCQTSIFVIAIF